MKDNEPDYPVTNAGGPRFTTFWMVYLEGRSAPTKKHESYVEAMREALRLSTKERRSAYVLETKCAFVVQDPVMFLPKA